MKSQYWYYRVRGAFYAYGPVAFQGPVTEKKFRAHLREIYKVKSLRWLVAEVWPSYGVME